MALPPILPPEFAVHDSKLSKSFAEGIVTAVRLGSIVRVSCEVLAPEKTPAFKQPETAWRHFVKEYPEYKDALGPSNWLPLDAAQQFAAWFIANCKERPDTAVDENAPTKREAPETRRRVLRDSNTNPSASLPPAKKASTKEIPPAATPTTITRESTQSQDSVRQFQARLDFFRSLLEAYAQATEGKSYPRDEFVQQFHKILFAFDAALLIPQASALRDFVKQYCPAAKEAINWTFVYHLERPQVIGPPTGDLIQL
jgi:hypothetical protein